MKDTTSDVAMPSAKELLKAGVQFGHETKRWNPKMKKYIFGSKNNIHILDVQQTEASLKKASDFLIEASSRGKVLFVGTKRQASEIVKSEAIRAGAYFINVRWAGGLLTNFAVVKKSLDKLTSIESQLESGVGGRTKYEVSRMKKEWQRLDRLYSGIKSLNEKPAAVIIVDANYEKAAVRECRKIAVPIVAIVDTNSDPASVDYPIPANDDAIGSISLLIKTLADAVVKGNGGTGVKHDLQDYSKLEVKIVKVEEAKGEDLAKLDVPIEGQEGAQQDPRTVVSKAPEKTRGKSKGILERVKEEAESKKTKKSKTAKAAPKKTAKKAAK